MSFESFASAHSTIIWLAFAIAFIMGAVATKTNFCTMGAVSDLVNMGDSGRIRAWFLAIAVAMIGVTIVESMNLLSVDVSRPPYRGSSFAWLEYILGGVMFGVGMTLGSGCGNKTLIRIGGGNLKSIVLFAVIAVCAYFMVNPFPGTDKTIYSEVFYGWTNATTISLIGQQDLGSLLAGILATEVASLRLILGLVIGVALLIIVFRSADFRSTKDNIISGSVIGLCVLGAWYISGGMATIEVDGETYSWVSYANVDNWSMLEESKSPDGIAVQSYTFINPIGESLRYALNGFNSLNLTFGLAALFGVITGALFWSLVSKNFRIEWFASFRDFATHIIGGILMGIGGVLALGCTIGQGITGVSTLAVGSMLALVSIIFGSALTMKIQYYKLIHEDEATFVKAFVSSLVDFKMLPASMRKLENY
ncbi:MAG: YeeE/YedE family protein [Gammaproteobacteria bacterium]|nr:YeeE/YedE family protein [Gammaproteobacteria bacterium]